MTSLLVLLASCWVLGGATVTTKGHMYVDVSLNNKMFTGNITHESAAQNARECSLKCNGHESCVAFTFHQNTCRGHAVPMTFFSVYKPKSGAKSFARKSQVTAQTGVKRLTDTSLGLDMDVYYEDDWLVVQRRQDGSVDFNLTWQDYVTGFGDVRGEFWLGLEPLHLITASGVNYDLRVDLMTWNGTCGSAYYSKFSVDSATEFYKLRYGSFVRGTAGDSLWYHKDINFSTWDADQDADAFSNIALYGGAGWPKKGYFAKLNGRYDPGETVGSGGILWMSFTGGKVVSLKSCRMMIRPED